MNIYAEQEHISNLIRQDKNFYESTALETVKNKVPLLNRTVLDIGANIGNHSVFFSDICGAKVLSFEPNVTNFSVLLRNCTGRNIIPFNTLVGNAGTYAQKIINESNMGSISYGKSDSGELAMPIDALGLYDVALIKIDVEGMEYDVLLGAIGTMGRCSPAIMVEIEGNDSKTEKLLIELGYDITKLNCHSHTILAVKNI